jgi:hypothetical protein
MPYSGILLLEVMDITTGGALQLLFMILSRQAYCLTVNDAVLTSTYLPPIEYR